MQRKVISALLRVINPELTIKWNEEHYCKLNGMALDLLCEITPLLHEEFLTNDGIVRYIC